LFSFVLILFRICWDFWISWLFYKFSEIVSSCFAFGPFFPYLQGLHLDICYTFRPCTTLFFCCSFWNWIWICFKLKHCFNLEMLYWLVWILWYIFWFVQYTVNTQNEFLMFFYFYNTYFGYFCGFFFFLAHFVFFTDFNSLLKFSICSLIFLFSLIFIALYLQSF
jgi:hypothetical protein